MLATRFAPSSDRRYEIALEVLEDGWRVQETQTLNVAQPPPIVEFDELRFRMGVNMAWQSDREHFHDIVNYKRWLSQFARHGGGLVRIFLTRWGLGIMPSRYSPAVEASIQLDRAWQLDWVLRHCSEFDIAVVLCLFTFSDFKSGVGWDWENNPLSIACGGPCRAPLEGFTSMESKEWFDRLLRYIIARWGAYKCIAAWELFNEIDQVDGYRRNAVRGWLCRTRQLVESIDQYRRPILSSHSSPSEIVEQQKTGHTIRQLHNYGWPSSSPVDNSIYWADYLRVDRKSAWLFSEFSLRSDEPPVKDDADGEKTRQALWASLFAGWTTPAWPWYWDSHLDMLNLWAIWEGLNRFCSATDWLQSVWRTTPVKLLTPRPSGQQAVTQPAVGGIRRMGYLLSRYTRLMHARSYRKITSAGFHNLRFWFRTHGSNRPLALALSRRISSTVRQYAIWVMTDRQGESHIPNTYELLLSFGTRSDGGSYRARYWNTRTGEVIAMSTAACAAEELRLFLPQFDNDLAVDVLVNSAPDSPPG